MTRTAKFGFAALLAVATVVTTLPATAATFFGWQVTNVDPWDKLNVRAYPSNKSQILTAYPNGTPLSLTGRCTKDLHLEQIAHWSPWQQRRAVRYRWCEVWVDPAGYGDFRPAWVYGRYIKPL